MKSDAEVSVAFLRHDEGGRKRPPLLNGYCPHLRVPPSKEMLGVRFVDGPETHSAGDTVHAVIEFLYKPQVSYDALVIGARFEIVEGPTIVGHGVIAAI